MAEISRKARQNNINIIFAVTSDEPVQRLYKRLSEHVAGSVVGELSSSADNIIKIVKDEYHVMINVYNWFLLSMTML